MTPATGPFAFNRRALFLQCLLSACSSKLEGVKKLADSDERYNLVLSLTVNAITHVLLQSLFTYL